MENQNIQLLPQQHEVLVGHLLGDGMLELRKTGHNASFKILRASSDTAFLEWSASVFCSFLTPAGIQPSSYFDVRTQKTYHSVMFRTRCSFLWTTYYSEWYGSGKKRVPRDIELSPATMCVWLADDGCVSIGKSYRGATRGTAYPSRLTLKLATQGFEDEDVLFLRDKIRSTYDVDVRPYKDKSGLTLRVVNSMETKKLLRQIDHAWPEGMDRKCQIWRCPKADLLETKKVRPACVYCGESHASKNGHSRAGSQKYRCGACKGQFLEKGGSWTIPA